MDDFEPEQAARQIGATRKLLELRTKLSDLRGPLQDERTVGSRVERDRWQHRIS
jgi:type VI secretion system ImpB/VipA family protein